MQPNLFAVFENEIVAKMLDILSVAAPVWLPILLGYIFWRVWTTYTFYWAEHRQGHILLEIRLPRDISKTPIAMEIILAGLHITSGESTFIERYWLGKRRPWFSLELVSLGGQVHFFIWTRAFFKNIVESAIYAQYPEVEIYEVPDYASELRYDKETTAAWGIEYKFTRPDPYPIKTYIDYGMERPGEKEEFKSDPLTALLEYLGSCQPSGQIWIQFLIQSHKKDKPQRDTLFGKTTWKEEAEALADKILRRDPKTKVPTTRMSVGEFGFLASPILTDAEKHAAEAILRSIDKLAFNVGIRGIYIDKPGTFKPVYVVGLIGCLKQFNSVELNGFAPAVRWSYSFGYPWQFERLRTPRMMRKLLKYYRERAYFHPPYRQQPLVMTTEELATLYHLPGGVATTPTLGRVMARKAEPPTNLPI